MEPDRIPYPAAQKILGVAKSTLKGLADARGWEVVYEITPHCKRRMFLLSDVVALAIERGQAKRDAANGVVARKTQPHKIKSKAAETMALVAWIDGDEENDGLTKWPSDEEIQAHTSDRYRFRDVEGVIDEIVFRFKDPSKALRQPAMRVKDYRGKMYL